MSARLENFAPNVNLDLNDRAILPSGHSSGTLKVLFLAAKQDKEN